MVGTEKSRYAFFISDRTGITSEGLGEALLNRFDYVDFQKRTYPFIDSIEKAETLVKQINKIVEDGHPRPLIFSSIVNTDIRETIHHCQGFHIDFFDTFIHLLEKELKEIASNKVGKTHGVNDAEKYARRMDAVNFSLNHDDGLIHKNLKHADIILVGVSRSGKTPTCLYLALNYGIRAANYPLIEDDLDKFNIPRLLAPYQDKLFGLTIDPGRLHGIRTERRPDSKYADLENCEKEVIQAEKIFKYNKIPYISSTNKSVEELAASVMAQTGLKRQF
ncbi:MAG: pyruvate, phosphate dikinase/phosphoenolpyruvate synthase regulator [Neisseriaceae bacterium]|nr:MAG: pyruvate, phosphate dikinase/phosphoenolpyruvate synthase regulator [Neisseriaceae bacterium]